MLKTCFEYPRMKRLCFRNFHLFEIGINYSALTIFSECQFQNSLYKDTRREYFRDFFLVQLIGRYLVLNYIFRF